MATAYPKFFSGKINLTCPPKTDPDKSQFERLHYYIVCEIKGVKKNTSFKTENSDPYLVIDTQIEYILDGNLKRLVKYPD